MVVPKPPYWVALLLKWHPTSIFSVVLVTIASVNMTFFLCAFLWGRYTCTYFTSPFSLLIFVSMLTLTWIYWVFYAGEKEYGITKTQTISQQTVNLGRITSCQVPLRVDTFKADLSAERTTSGDRLHILLRALNFFCVSINFSSLCSRLSEAPWFHWSAAKRTVISIWQQLTGYTQLLCLWLWYNDTDSYLDCPLSYQLSLRPWLLDAGRKCQSPTPGSFGFKTPSNLFLTLCCQNWILLLFT